MPSVPTADVAVDGQGIRFGVYAPHHAVGVRFVGLCRRTSAGRGGSVTIRPLKDRVIVETARQTESATPSGVILIEDHAQAVVGRVIAASETAEIQPEDVVIF